MNSKNYYIWLFIVFLLPVTVFADVESPKFLVGIYGIDNPDLEFGDYINALYALSISIAALLAVIKIIIAGVKWMLSDIVTSKQEAKSDIWGATLGLLLVISAVLILGVINPQLTTTGIFLTPAANIGTNTPYVEETEASCVAANSETQSAEWIPVDGNTNGGHCVRKMNSVLESNKVSCPLKSLSTTEYDCTEKIQECENSMREWYYAKSSFNGMEFKNYIICENKPKPTS